jgi:hypothetical protein
MSLLNLRRRNYPAQTGGELFKTRRRLSAANARGGIGQSGKRRNRSRQSTFPATLKRRRALMNSELLGCHFGSGNAIGYLLKRDIASVVR